jgi:hypothetical protein
MSRAECRQTLRSVVGEAGVFLGLHLYDHDGKQACEDLTVDSRAFIVKKAREKFGASRRNDDTCAEAVIAYYLVIVRRGETRAEFGNWAARVRNSAVVGVSGKGGFVQWTAEDYRHPQLVVDETPDHHWLVNLMQSDFSSTA